MGIIRLTLITLALLVGAMLYFGRDDGLPDNRLGRAPTAPPPSAAPTLADTTPLADGPAAVPDPEPLEETAPTPAAAPADTAPTDTAAVDTAPADTPPARSASETALDAALSEALATPELPSAPDATVATPAPASANPAAPVLYVTGSRVNVRSGPATVYAAIDSLTRGTPVDDLGDAGEGWRMIRLPSGETGYMSGDFLSATAP